MSVPIKNLVWWLSLKRWFKTCLNLILSANGYCKIVAEKMSKCWMHVLITLQKYWNTDHEQNEQSAQVAKSDGKKRAQFLKEPS